MAVELDAHLIAGLVRAERRLPVILSGDRRSISGRDQVSLLQTSFEGGRSPVDEARNPNTAGRRLRRGRPTPAAPSSSPAETLIEHADPGSPGVALAKDEAHPREERCVVRYVASLDVLVEEVVGESPVA